MKPLKRKVWLAVILAAAMILGLMPLHAGAFPDGMAESFIEEAAEIQEEKAVSPL